MMLKSYFKDKRGFYFRKGVEKCGVNGIKSGKEGKRINLRKIWTQETLEKGGLKERGEAREALEKGHVREEEENDGIVG